MRPLGTPVAVATQTVGEFLEVWLRDVAANKVRPATLKTYRMYATRHLVPGLGAKRLARLTPAEVRRSWPTAPGPALPRRPFGNCTPSCGQPSRTPPREDLVPRNVARLVAVPTPPRHEVQPLTPTKLANS